MMSKEVNVHIGEVRISKGEGTLKAILGSCVGVGLIWRSKNICGLAHCLLPENPTPSFSISGRFVDQAVVSLLAMMKIRESDFPEVEAIVVGGGNMTSHKETDASKLVGSNNSKKAQSELEKRGIKIVMIDIGGEEGRKVILNCSNCTYRVEKIPRIPEVA